MTKLSPEEIIEELEMKIAYLGPTRDLFASYCADSLLSQRGIARLPIDITDVTASL